MIYDGECAFCRQSVAEIRRRDRDCHFTYLARNTPGIEERYPQVTTGSFEEGLRLIEEDGTMYIGSDAIFRIARQLPVLRRFAWLYRVPVLNGVTKRVYTWVAANRMRISRYCTPNTECQFGAENQNESKPHGEQSRATMDR